MYSTSYLFLSILPNPSAVANLLPWRIREFGEIRGWVWCTSYYCIGSIMILRMDRVCKTKPFNWLDCFRQKAMIGSSCQRGRPCGSGIFVTDSLALSPGLGVLYIHMYVFILRSTVLIAIGRTHCSKRNRERCALLLLWERLYSVE